MNTQVFNHDHTQDHSAFSDYDRDSNKKAQGGLWEVNDKLADNPTYRFTQKNTMMEVIYEGGGSPMSGVSIPRGLITFLRERFLPPLNISSSQYANLESVIEDVFRYIDYEEPYFFLVDMPISLLPESYDFSYKDKTTGSVLDPENIEVFRVQYGWDYRHYKAVQNIILDPRTAIVCRQQQKVMGPKGRPMVTEDILEAVSKIVYGNYDGLCNLVEFWITNFYEGLRYDSRTTPSASALDDISLAEENDALFWKAVTLGMFTWLKSPHGMKFLIQYHPIYYELLTWNYETGAPEVVKGTDGWGAVVGWTIYTGAQLERLAVAPGTCCVSQLPLHCTRRVNAKATLSPCACGKMRKFDQENYWEDRADHRDPTCIHWERANEPLMVFVSYGALDNILNKRPAGEPGRCPRYTCPKISCPFHSSPNMTPDQQRLMRMRELTERRTKMLTSSRTP